MNISFDKFEQFEAPILTLCNPNSEATIKDGKITLSNTLGLLPDCKKVVLSPNFNTQWELSFEFSDNSNEQLHRMYKRLEKGRYIYVSDVGYFIIDDYTRHESDERVYKEISCHSVDKEIKRNECPLLDEGSYYFYSKENDEGTVTEGIIQKQMSLLPKWTLGFVSNDLKDKTAYFDGENKSNNAYEFLWEEIEEAYECVIDVDFISRTLSFYSLEYYATHHRTDIHLSKSNDLKEVVIESKDDDCFTAITVKQNDNLSLVYSNPNGSETLYNFTHCFNDMSPELQAALTKWQEKYEATILPYRTLSEQWANALDDLTNAEKDLDILKEELNNLKIQRDSIINSTVSDTAKQTDLNNISSQISAKEQAISAQENVITTKKANIKTTYEEPLQAYANECSLSLTAKDTSGNLIFTQDLLNELSAYINPAEYSDDYITQTDDMKYTEIYQQSNKLFDRAKRELKKLSTQSYTFSVENNSFLFNKKFERFSKQLVPGSIVYLETSDDTMEQVHLTNFSIDYDDCSVSFTFGNKYDENDLKSLFDDVFGSVKTSAAAVKYLKNIVNDQRSELEKQRDYIDNVLTLTKDHALTSNHQTVVVDDSGYWGRKLLLDKDGNVQYDTRGNPLYENEQLKIINNGVYLTTDNWGSLATAVGKIYLYHDEETGKDVFRYGVAGDLIVGKLFLGKELTLLGNVRSDGTYAITLNENGLTIINDGSTAGITIKDANGNKQFYADENGSLWLSGNINAIGGTIGGWKIGADRLYREHSSGQYYGTGMSSTTTGGDPAFWAGYHGNGDTPWDEPHWQSLTNFYITNDGAIKASAGNIAGWEIYSDCFTKVVNIGGGQSRRVTIGSSLDNPAFGVTSDNWDSGIIFRVNWDGSLYATNANISGTINAESGSIDAWTIGNGGIYYSNGASGCGLVGDNRHANIAIYAGANTSNIGGAPFRVYHDGSLVATNANITGTITATSGTFNGTVNANSGHIGCWHIGQSGYGGQDAIIANDGSNYVALSASGVYETDSASGSDLYRTWGAICVAASGSDARLKDNVEDIDENIDKLYFQLQPKQFSYKPTAHYGNPQSIHYGLIAQNLVSLLQEYNIKNSSVIWDEEEFLGICYQELITLNIWQIQKLKKEISILEKRLSNIE